MSSTKFIMCPSCNLLRRYGGRGACKTCYHQLWKAENREHCNQYNKINRKQLREQNPEKYRDAQRRRYREMSWVKRVLGQSGPDRKDISAGFLSKLQSETTNCPCCKIALDYDVNDRVKGSKRLDNQATLDKVIPVLGYTESNIAIICFRCNKLKDAMTLDELRMIIAYIEEYLNGREVRVKTA